MDWLKNEEATPVQILEEKSREKLTNEGIRAALGSLDERSRRVIEARWLHTDDEGNLKPLTLQELAQEMGISAERVRQIEKKALLKMRSSLSAEKDDLDS